MQLHTPGQPHLTYCTNIHPGESWDETLANLRHYAPLLKRQLSPEAPFGVGLRLSDQASRELLEGERLSEFRAFLAEEELYVALINGFPFGAFHHQVVKEQVFAPDWRDEARVDYTLRLVDILASVLPAPLNGGISTSPLSYKRWVQADDAAMWEQVSRNVARVVVRLVQVRRATGKLIHLDLEPEPDGLIENTPETLAFLQDWLLPVGGTVLAESLGLTADEAEACLREHVRLCYDTCHFAVEYEAPAEVLARFAAAGWQIGRVQVSSALRVPLPPDAAARDRLDSQLRRFAEPTYLHQVIERRSDGSLARYPDLIQALPSIHDPEAREWRIHFHVPLFVAEYGEFHSTQADILAAFECYRQQPYTRHLEIETYTWDVLPDDLKEDRAASIRREFEWVRAQFSSPGAALGGE